MAEKIYLLSGIGYGRRIEMKILKMKVKWNLEWANEPQFQVLVDKMPSLDELRYESLQKDQSRLLFAEKDGYVNFTVLHTNSNGNPIKDDGYGGRHRSFTLTDESILEVSGGWSSRTGVMNKYFTQSMEVSITDNPKSYERGYTFYAGAITLLSALGAIERLLPDTKIIKINSYGEEIYVPALKYNSCKCVDSNTNDRCNICKHRIYKDSIREL